MAEHWLSHARALRRAHGESQNVINDLAWLGRLCLAQGDTARAFDLTSEAVERLNARQVQGRIFETWDVLLAHAETSQAGGCAEDAARYVALAHEHLLDFAAQITDAQVRHGFLDFNLSTRVIAARQSGVACPFPYFATVPPAAGTP